MTQTLSLKSPNNSYESQSYNSFPVFKQRESIVTLPDHEGENSTTPFEKLTYNLKHNSIYTKEIVLGKLIGFYRIGDEIGKGNFSKVKRGAHLLTKGNSQISKG
jgi:hypothetical protein